MQLLDVSNNNGTIDWAKIPKIAATGVWIKATEGMTYTDPLYAANVKAAKAHGFRVGAYHFARPELNHTPAEEASHFCSVVGKIGRRDLRPVLDMETVGGDEDWARAFCHYVTKHLGVMPMFYSYTNWIEVHKFKVPVGDGLWLANYSGLLHPPVAPKPWKKYVAWQYTDKGKVDGVTGFVDRSVGSRGVLAHPVLGLL